MQQVTGRLRVSDNDKASVEIDGREFVVDDLAILDKLFAGVPLAVGGDFLYDQDVDLECEISGTAITSVKLLVLRTPAVDYHVKGER